jgi:ADP-ribose pyrophosphatase
MKPDSSRTAYDGKLIDVTVERWGEHEREIVEHPGAVAIVAIDREGMLNLVRQRREAVRTPLVELPAGTLEEGEAPLASARRELAEETGLTGGTWRQVAAFYTTRASAASGCTSSSPRSSTAAMQALKATRSSR